MKSTLTRLRIAGFKSFAEPVTLDILPGLTGIVGPNGCGKSNVVEALRWAMGETSAKSLRGGEMDDVIFAGTTARPSRNRAEVTITLEGELPDPFAAEAELAVTRRIERGAGSAFRANGRELRARDVQTLYADMASGARSSGIVSQGRVSALVGARPEDRRQVLEEAAGITGLHARRHEAELKLRAAESNLGRAEDVRVQIEQAQESLRRQAKAAARYRNISGLIRAAEADHLAILLGQAEAALHRAGAAHDLAAQAAAGAMRAVQDASAVLASAEAALPGPRAQEAVCRSTLERRRIEAENLAAEAAQAAASLAESQARLRDIEADVADAAHRRDEAAAMATHLGSEASTLSTRLLALPALHAQAEDARDAAAQIEQASEQSAQGLAAAAAEAVAAARAAEQATAAAARALDSARTRLAQCQRDHDWTQASRIDPSAIEEARQKTADATSGLAAARDIFDRAEQSQAAALAALAGAEASAQRTAMDHQAAATRVEQADRVAAVAAEALAGLTEAAAKSDAARVPAAEAEAAEDHADAARGIADAAEQAMRDAEQAAHAAEGDLQSVARAASDAVLLRTRLSTTAEDARRRCATLATEIVDYRARIDEAMAACPDPDRLAQLEADAVASAAEAERHKTDLLWLGDARAAAESRLEAARTAAAAAAAEVQRTTAEADGLQAALGGATADADDRAIDSLVVPPGLEAAVAAALGEAADYALDEGAPCAWANLPPLIGAPLPEGSIALSTLVGAPNALMRALSQTAVIDSAEYGTSIQPLLSPGQIAVTRAGDAWRWDGPTSRAGAESPAAARLHQRNRLKIVGEAAGCARTGADAAAKAAAAAEAAVQAARRAETEARQAEAGAALRARTAGAAYRDQAAASAQARSRQAALLPELTRLEDLHAATETASRHHDRMLDTLPDPADHTRAQAAAEATLATHRKALEEARRTQEQTRTAALRAQDEARRIAAAADAAAQRAALIAPQLARAQLENATARDDRQRAEAALAITEDPAPRRGQAETARQDAQAAVNEADLAKLARGAAEQALEVARDRHADVAAEHQRIETRLAAQTTLLAQAAQDHAAAEAQQAAAAAVTANLPDTAALALEAANARTRVAEARQHTAYAASVVHSLHAETAQAEARQASVAGECLAWQTRLADASDRCARLTTRAAAARAQCDALSAVPGTVGARNAAADAALSEAEAAHAAAAEALAATEEAVRTASAMLRQADAAEAASRASLARAEGTNEAARGALEAVQARIAERLSQHGRALDEELPKPADLSDAAEERTRRRAERLAREREEMGPVNLRADLELAELDERAATLERECDDLQTAIAKLRGAIGHLNREGRARLTAVFTEVDRHFRTLFTRMMGGGRAHLALTGSDDPLLAGLEIYAEPPGKKLSTLSLLSGGEQALTALSLIFAVFRCTPAPISVLDEVDAPLDDANVERFCTLLDDVVRDTGTRFLVVTHHQLTMSRMDRLFGVTMQERGVSRLLSVDLQRASAMIEETLQAAE